MIKVWKRFFYKVFVVTVWMVGVFATVLGGILLSANYLGDPGIGLFGSLIMLFVLFLLKETYADSRREIERENEKLMRELGRDR